MADLPVMPEWIDHPAQAPSIRLCYADDLARTGRCKEIGAVPSTAAGVENALTLDES